MDKFKLIKNFSSNLASTLELEELANVITDFAVVELGAEHASVIANGKAYHYRGNSDELKCGIEKIAFKYSEKVKKQLFVSNPANEYIFKDIKGISNFHVSLITIPLITKNKFLGTLNLYFKPPVADISDFLDIFTELSSSSIMNSLAYSSMETKSSTDALTGLSNRRSFDLEIEKSIEQCAESKIPLSIMMIDLDNFKEYNDKHGHQKGDSILTDVGKAICSVLDSNGRAFRYGGEEMSVILEDKKQDKALEFAEKIRKNIEFATKITASIGLVTCVNSSCSASKMISEADSALYKAKDAGKNRVHSILILDRALAPIDINIASEIGKKQSS